MASFSKINPFSKVNNNTGFGNSAGNYGGRFINKDGSFNIQKEGGTVWDRSSIYQHLLTAKPLTFLFYILAGFVGINLFFTGVYYIIGTDKLTGYASEKMIDRFWEVYFFSCQTFTTVGYGRMNPVGFWADLTASLEALLGFSAFALMTGLLYGRFTKPTAYIRFSVNALISPYQGGQALMFRLVPYKTQHIMSDADVRVNISLTVQDSGQPKFQFYNLDLERNHVDSLSMNWTVVHPITEQSPLYNLSAEDLKAADAEIYVLFKGFDDVFSANVLARTSYRYDEVVYNAKFELMYRESDDDSTTILELHKLNNYKLLG